jgi:hypothetical protein
LGQGTPLGALLGQGRPLAPTHTRKRPAQSIALKRRYFARLHTYEQRADRQVPPCHPFLPGFTQSSMVFFCGCLQQEKTTWVKFSCKGCKVGKISQFKLLKYILSKQFFEKSQLFRVQKITFLYLNDLCAKNRKKQEKCKTMHYF